MSPTAAGSPPRILLFTGKGGVGKTTVASATAVACADRGLRTLAMSTDPAHSLADAFGLPLGDEPRPVVEHLWAQQLDTHRRFEAVWGEVQGYARRLLGWVGADTVEAEELAVVPGLDEVFALADLKAHATSGKWDVVVVDCAPTAETIRLLSAIDILSWYVSRLFPAGRAMVGAMAPVLSAVTTLPLPGDEIFDAASRLLTRLEGVREVLTESPRTTARLVVTPERMVVAESRRTFTYLSLFGYRTDAVVLNRMLPGTVTDPWFERWRARHAEQVEAISAAFAPVPLLWAELAAEEVVGVERLRRYARALYGETDPAAVLHEAEPLRVDARGGDRVLSIRLPCVDPADVDVGSRDGELLVKVGSWRRAVLLPDSLRGRATAGARILGDRLEVTFLERSEVDDRAGG